MKQLCYYFPRATPYKKLPTNYDDLVCKKDEEYSSYYHNLILIIKLDIYIH